MEEEAAKRPASAQFPPSFRKRKKATKLRLASTRENMFKDYFCKLKKMHLDT